ncbi:MAG: amidohydrolase family protein [Acidobacteriota bacterium]|jgi:5-methylthioadenosine/S-adenosylhomocysteine deaminase|nr:amidohydrolase family protein [Acidobacteriota bacterium]
MQILSAAWLLPISAEPISNGAIAIEENKIVAVGTITELIQKFPAHKSENFGEAVILPGFVNTHSHLEITAMRGFLDDVEEDFYSWLIKLTATRAEKLTEKDIETSAMCGALEGVRAGITCFADIGRFGKAGFEALKLTGLRGILFQETEFSPKDSEAETDFAKLKDKFLALKEKESELVKVGLSPHAPYTVSRRLFEKITDYSLSENIKLTIHAAESKQEEDFFQTGKGFFADVYQKLNLEWDAPHVSSIQYLDQLGVLRAKPLLAHCVKISEKDIDSIASSGSSIAHCPKSNAKFGHGSAPLERFLDKNVRVGFGSDSVASNNTCDILEEARFATLFARNSVNRKKFLSARDIIKTATLGGAAALGLESEIGTLEIGKQADLIVISLNNMAQMPIHDVYTALLFASNARDVKMTMVAGKEIYRDGITEKLDEERLKREIQAIEKKMRKY